MKNLAKILDLSHLKDKKIIIVGDIHGCFNQFHDLICHKCSYNPDLDIIVSLGDLCDRGPASDFVLDFFMNVKNTYCVIGNHDWKLLRYLKGNPIKISNGLQETINQIKELDKQPIIEYLENLPNIIRLPDLNKKPFYAAHAGVDTRFSIDKQSKETTMYIRGIDSNNYFDESKGIWYDTLDGSYTVTAGHIVEKSINPNPNVFCLDGGCCHGGVLRAMVIQNGKYEIKETQGLEVKKENLSPVEARDNLVAQGLLRSDKLDRYKIYTYTDRCVYDDKWDDTTINSRGHIFDIDTNECIAHPFPKFFNIGEKPELCSDMLPWHKGFDVYNKMDGWIGILYRHNGQFKIASRGSFYSEGAVWATKFLNDRYDLSSLPDYMTLVFEIISPVTKIIVDYKNFEGLVLIGAFNRINGYDFEYEQLKQISEQYNIPIVEKLPLKSVEEIQDFIKLFKGNEMEGVVVRFTDNTRVKIKSTDYLVRHKIKSRLTPLAVWESIVNNIDIQDIQAIMTQEEKDEYNRISNLLNTRYRQIELCIYLSLDELKRMVQLEVSDINYFKEFDLALKKIECPDKSIMFAALKGQKDKVKNYILKQIRPTNNLIENAV
jgi:RNA ligase